MTHTIAIDQAACERHSAPARELAQRRTGTVEVRLLWHRETDGVRLSVRDDATGAGFDLEVAPADAIDAFYHPYAYAAKCESAPGALTAETSTLDG